MKSIKWLKNTIRVVIVLLCTALIFLLIYQSFGTMIPGLIRVLKSGNEKEIADYLSNAGKLDGMLCTIVLQMVQVISIVIPGMPIQIAAGMVYGAFRAFLFTYFGYVSANVIVFAVARHIGTGLVENISFKKKSSWLENKFKTIRPEFVVSLACLMPAVPNGIVPYLAARTQITYINFTLAVAMGSGIPILLSCLTGHFILKGNYTFSIISIVLLWTLIIFVVRKQDLIFNILDKRGVFRKKDN